MTNRCEVRGARYAALLLTMTITNVAAQEDPHLWLEEVDGRRQLEWVHKQNAQTRPILEATPGFRQLHDRLLAIYTSRERIPNVQKRGDYLYNFWQDASHPRGLLRRTTFAEYRKKEPAWEVVLDVTKLSADEKVNWAYKGSNCLYPEYRRCLISLSRGGADAVEIREFDMHSKQFVKEGFFLPQSKGAAAWRDADTIYVSRDFGPGTLTKSGYPRIVKEWARGTPLAEAKVIYEAKEDDVGAWPSVANDPGRKYEWVTRVISTRYSENFLRRGERWVMVDVPRDADVIAANGLLLVRLRGDWKPAAREYKGGSLLSADLDKFLAGSRELDVVFEPAERVSLQAYSVTKSHLVLDVLDNVKGRVIEARFEDGKWIRREVAVPPMSSIGLSAVDRDTTDEYWMTVTSYIEPTTLYLAKAGSDARERMKGLPAFFDAKGLKVLQYEATSRDGTRIPYFVITREDAKLDGRNPTVLYGYGGFEQSMTPTYSANVGAGWLEAGGTWAVANLRGGGEFGPQWHLVARREGRQKTHDDYIAVAEDLVKRRITSPRHLGIYGGSQGGLLVGAVMAQRQDLFNAVVATVPLFDMQRYHKLLAGASWMGEYGDPDKPEDWAFIGKYSPYQNVVKGTKYPKLFIATTTRDDRVHPGHARKMFAKMREQGHEVLYFENTEGGHGSGTTPEQQALFNSLIYAFFRKELF